MDPLEDGSYLTDDEALYCIVIADENGVLLEDCSGLEEVTALSFEEFAAKRLRRVEPASA